MVEALNPNLMQSIEGQPVLVHAGPFANIAIGQSSIIADRVGLKLGDYHLTESGFGADIGFEKFWNLKCRFSGLKPNAAVLVATIRALKSHGGAPIPVPGKPMPEEYSKENVGFVEAGCKNLIHHINTVKKSGVSPVVCINAFYTDTKKEIVAVRRLAEKAGARVALSEHWQHGGAGAVELADAVVEACEDKNKFKLLYDLKMPLRKRIDKIAKDVYGADGVDYTPDALAKAKRMEEDKQISKLGTCMVKTHLSLSDNPRRLRRPGCRYDKTHAWHGFGPRLQTRRRGCEDRKGQGSLLGITDPSPLMSGRVSYKKEGRHKLPLFFYGLQRYMNRTPWA
jgi:formate--tetrahydrofolate ligase